jgi:hypothetical protein
MEAVRTLKANLKLQNKPCGWCQVGLQLGEDAAVCTACEKEHHQRCWDGSGGCSTVGCANAPLRQLQPPPGPPPMGAPMGYGQPQGAPMGQMPPGMMQCPHCRAAIPWGTPVCTFCRMVTSPDGVYHGPMINAPGAAAALTYGIIGLFICGIIFGPLAISKANAAKRAIAENPTYGGGGMATAGLVLGILDVVAWAIIVMVRLSAA